MMVQLSTAIGKTGLSNRTHRHIAIRNPAVRPFQFGSLDGEVYVHAFRHSVTHRFSGQTTASLRAC